MSINIRQPTEEELEWIKYRRDTIKASPKAIDDVAKYLVTSGTTLSTIYVAGLTLFDIPEKIVLSPGMKLILLYIPIVLWIASIGLNIYACFPAKYILPLGLPDDDRNAIKNIISTKYDRLQWGAILFSIALLVSAWAVLYIGTKMQSQNEINEVVEFVIPKEQIDLFRNMSFEVENNSLKTNPVKLLRISDGMYAVKQNDQRELEFSKELVSGIIYNKEPKIKIVGLRYQNSS